MPSRAETYQWHVYLKILLYTMCACAAGVKQCLCVYMSVCLCLCVSACLSVCVSVCLCVCVPISKKYWTSLIFHIQKPAGPSNVVIHSGKPNSVGWRLCRHHEYLAARFWRFCSRSASRRHVYIASGSQYPSQSHNCGRLLIAALYAKQPSKLPKSTQVRSHGNNVHDVIIAHVISVDAHIYIYIQTQKRQSNLRTSRPRAKHAATGKKST